MKRMLLTMVVALSVGIGGCASNLSGQSYSRAEARTVQQVQYGTVEAVRPVQIEGTKTPVGPLAGAVVGGVGASAIGQGRGSAVAAAVGAVAGGLAGAAAEEGLTRRQGVEITVRLDSDRTIAVVQQAAPGESFAPGDRVRVLTGANVRVTR